MIPQGRACRFVKEAVDSWVGAGAMVIAIVSGVVRTRARELVRERRERKCKKKRKKKEVLSHLFDVYLSAVEGASLPCVCLT